MDPEPEILREAATRGPKAAGVANLTWAAGSSADLPGASGQFRLVTMGRSFHWMNREQVLAALGGMVTDDGGLVIVGDSCLVQANTPWQRTVEAVQQQFLAPTRHPLDTGPGQPAEQSESILARSVFRHVEPRTYEFSRRWTTEQIIGYLYSTSFPLRQILGDRRTAFEHALADALGELPDSDLVEPVVF